MEHEPQNGQRCTECFEMRFERTALYAHEHGFDAISNSLGISRWKDFNQVTHAGERAASRYSELTYSAYKWRKAGGASRMIEIRKLENFYQQDYCGCAYLLRDTNRHRISADVIRSIWARSSMELRTQIRGEIAKKAIGSEYGR